MNTEPSESILSQPWESPEYRTSVNIQARACLGAACLAESEQNPDFWLEQLNESTKNVFPV